MHLAPAALPLAYVPLCLWTIPPTLNPQGGLLIYCVHLQPLAPVLRLQTGEPGTNRAC